MVHPGNPPQRNFRTMTGFSFFPPRYFQLRVCRRGNGAATPNSAKKPHCVPVVLWLCTCSKIRSASGVRRFKPPGLLAVRCRWRREAAPMGCAPRGEREVNGNIRYWRKPLFEGMFCGRRCDQDAGGNYGCRRRPARKDKYQECVCLIIPRGGAYEEKLVGGIHWSDRPACGLCRHAGWLQSAARVERAGC